MSCSPAPSSLVGTHSDARLAVMIGVTMVGNSLFVAFTCNELLAECLAGHVAGFNPILACCFDSCLISGLEVIVIITGIFECALITTEVL